ncbi:hypothetical protein THASP1DRAFT_24683 [Thamnocephalis sphaerospora]|uniref:F-box domain-containing protein n=1 Tax=Thamnocephalis sphaerospora TaxID=78915 RepID=A0A4P9XMJ1_9FUNG|nr:hypothetical protein THASP1DRAFT_24683 [Thamnocephalis sphaerospora]|eukprot:RKP07105.1 hypothetical protein THASP1DRAFT_24683 [Thamnocephalis sphaerospora]
MRHIPDELLEYIIDACTDEAALVVLSCTSRRLYIHVRNRQKLWRERFNDRFLQTDDNERSWMQQYMRAYQAGALGYGRSITTTATTRLSSQNDLQLDWFDVYLVTGAAEAASVVFGATMLERHAYTPNMEPPRQLLATKRTETVRASIRGSWLVIWIGRSEITAKRPVTLSHLPANCGELQPTSQYRFNGRQRREE